MLKGSSQRFRSGPLSLLREKFFIPYIVVLVSELAVIHMTSDLPVAIGNWIIKAEQIASFQIPESNFYGPGAALLLVPFLWLKESLFIVVQIYFVIGAIGYWKITNFIDNEFMRNIARAALPLNFYLIWLVHSSQDTVFEFMLLTWSAFFLVKKRYFHFTFVTYLLCQTRAGYWTFFLGTAVLLICIDYFKKRKFSARKALALPLLFCTSIFNLTTYGSPTPALESGMAIYFSYSKYHHLALPKMDMDVFLSGPRGIFTDPILPKSMDDLTPVEQNRVYRDAGLQSALENKKQTILGWMQKVDSYYFDVQKIPHLPGSYVLDINSKTISIENERLTWPLVFGHFLYFVSRILLLSLGVMSIGVFLALSILKRANKSLLPAQWPLVLPYLFGIIPGVLIYTETRFKIVSELLLVPLIIGIYSKLWSAGGQEVRFKNLSRARRNRVNDFV